MGAVRYGTDDGSSGSFRISLSPCTRAPQSWREEVLAAARTVANTAKKPLWLCFSGGVSSEIMCRSFFDQGIAFSVLTLDLEGGKVSTGAAQAKEWCWQRGVPHKLVTLDSRGFLEHDIPGYVADSYVAVRAFRFLQLRMLEIIEEMGGYAVIGDGGQVYSTIQGPVSLNFSSGEKAPIEWCRRNDTAHEIAFFRTTPELWRAYLDIPFVSQSLSFPEIFRHPTNERLLHRIVYQSTWPELEPHIKYAMFGSFTAIRRQAEMKLREQLRASIQNFQLPIPAAREQLNGDQV